MKSRLSFAFRFDAFNFFLKLFDFFFLFFRRGLNIFF
ncbi:hypothetical protein HRED_09882 [Candidatus Haloredivivus sp. G17]|nr:hypothetical protein HRED_09882 [Candidatus Haloredivivus sp. G17]